MSKVMKLLVWFYFFQNTHNIVLQKLQGLKTYYLKTIFCFSFWYHSCLLCSWFLIYIHIHKTTSLHSHTISKDLPQAFFPVSLSVDFQLMTSRKMSLRRRRLQNWADTVCCYISLHFPVHPPSSNVAFLIFASILEGNSMSEAHS